MKKISHLPRRAPSFVLPTPFSEARETASGRRALLVGAASLGFLFVGVALGQQAGGGAGGATGGSSKAKASANENGPVAAALEALSPAEKQYFQHVTVLSSPFFEGRGPGTRGNVLAAEYVEWNFVQTKLEPLFASGQDPDARRTYRQTFSIRGENKVKSSELSAGATSFRRGADYEVLSASGDATGTGSLVCVGYGIAEGEGEYNSFASLTGDKPLTGKVALVFRYEPLNDKGESQWTKSGGGFSAASTVPRKIKSLVDLGAAGIIMVSPPSAKHERAKELENLATMRAGPKRDIPVLMMTPEAADRLLATSGKTIAGLVGEVNAKPVVTELGVAVKLASETGREQIMADNIGGVLRGKGELADQYLIIGGHMDHVGYGTLGGSRAGERGLGRLHPGADDNASGTAGVLVAAKQMSEAYGKMGDTARRSVIFVCFNGEEEGLLGSRHMVKNLPVSKKSIYAMLNMDMIGRVRFDKVDAAGVGTAKGFAEWLKVRFDASPLKVRTIPNGQGPSDHASFYSEEIPVVHFFTGLHPQYHMPEDTYDLINPIGAVKVIDLVTTIGRDLAVRAEPLEYQSARGASIIMDEPKDDGSGPKPMTSPQPTSPASLTEGKKESMASPHGTGNGNDAAGGSGTGGISGSKVRFGIAPGNYGDDEPGVEVGDVYKGTAADAAGILKGDRLMKWNGTVIKSVEDWMPLLTTASPGDEVKIELKRGGETKTLTVKLKAREQGDK